MLHCLFTPFSFAQNTWSDPLQIDESAGTHPHVFFSKSGKLYVSYYDIQYDSMFIKYENTIGGSLSTPKNVIKGGKNVGIHFESDDVIDLMAARTNGHTVLKSVNSGNTWTAVKSITSSDNFGSSNTMGAFFTENGTDLRLFYSFVHYNAVVGEKPQLYYINRTGSTWDASGTFIADGSVCGAYENGQNISVIGTRGTYMSINNGSTFSEINSGAIFSEQLKANGTDECSGILYMVRSYSSANYVIALTKSNDNGSTWLSPQLKVQESTTNLYSYPKIAVKGDTMVVCWVEDPTPQMGINGYKKLFACHSFDGGLTFSSIDTIFNGTDYKVITTSYDDNRIDMDIANYNNRFVISYSVVLNNLANNQHTFIREVTYAEPSLVTQKNTNSLPEICVYPNPANDKIIITNFENGTIEIINLQGQTIKTINTSNTITTIDISKLSGGVYIIKVKTDIEIIFKKFIKK